MLEEIAIVRNMIKDKIEDSNENLEKIIIQIDRKEYKKIYNCYL